MANNLQVNRRLLLSILRAPPVHSPTRSPLCHQILAIRSISTSSSKYAPPSVSFGEETDQLIAALEPQKSRPKKRSPLAEQKAAERSGKGQQYKAILAKLERLDGSEQQKKKGGKDGGKEVKTSTVDVSNGKDETKRRAKKTRTVSKEKKAQRTPVKTKTKTVTITPQEDELYDEPVLIEVPEPVSDPSPIPIVARNTKSTVSEPKTPSRSIPKPTPATPSSPLPPTEPKPQSPTLRTPGSEPWQIQKHALQKKFTEGWQPRKKLSPDTLMGIRSLHERDPEKFSTEALSRQFAVSPEAIRRILRTKWGMTPEQLEERRQRWAKRHDRIWDHKAELGQRPARTRDKKVDGPEKFEEFITQKQALGEI